MTRVYPWMDDSGEVEIPGVEKVKDGLDTILWEMIWVRNTKEIQFYGKYGSF